MELEYQDPTLSTVWLLATLDSSKKNKKLINGINISKTCENIILISDKIPLRRTSNLMYGTVLAFKKQCINDWNEVSSCRMLIQRLGELKSKIVIKEKIDQVVLLKDDPKFDISQGLIEEWDDHMEKKEEEVEVEMDESMVVDRELFTQEKWDDVGFEFNKDGDVMFKNESDEIINDSVVSEQMVNDNIDAFDMDFGFINDMNINDIELDLNEDVAGNEPEINNDEAQPEKPTKPPQTRSNKRRKLLIDKDVMLNSETIMKIRDGYISIEQDKMLKRYKFNIQLFDLRVGEMTDINKYRDIFNTGSNDDNNHINNDEHDIPMNDVYDMDIEYGRIGRNSSIPSLPNSRQHSRSSSVSSIEQGRRATTRHSSSFHFDFEINNELPEKDMIVDDGIEDIGNYAMIDISLDNEGKEDMLHRIEHEETLFKDLVDGETRGLVVSKFMYLLELGSSGKVTLSQERLFSDIKISIV